MKEEYLSMETVNKLAELEHIKEKTKGIVELLKNYIYPTRQDHSFHSNPEYIVEMLVIINLLNKHILKEPVIKYEEVK